WCLALPLALGTFALISLTWVFFRADSFASAFRLLSSMAQPPIMSLLGPFPSYFWLPRLVSDFEAAAVLAVTGMLLLWHFVARDRALEDIAARLPWWGQAIALALMLTALCLAPGDDRAFIYFQF